jgi:2-keto-4-pentenoate hydratase/2-oxohepta-3-ene-1,7-dioic acid hydratase in catechol pathway
MRLVTYRSDRGPRAGVVQGKAVVDAWDALGGGGMSLRDLLAQERLAQLTELDERRGRPLAETELLPPVPDPEKIICIGLNYREHAAESGVEPPSAPTFFAKFRNALASPGATVPLPASSENVDFEAEVAFAVGRPAKEVPASTAADYIAGYTLLNDLSARDLQFATPQWMPGKVFDRAAPCGPALVTPEEALADDGTISFALTLNGERMQAASTADLIFSVPELLSRLSHLMTLDPGDLVATGTPSGVGFSREPPVWLAPGDEIEISSPTLGVLANRIAAGP